MKTLIKCFFSLTIGIVIGYFWCTRHYHPIQLEEQVKELKLDLKLLNKAYVRDIAPWSRDNENYLIKR